MSARTRTNGVEDGAASERVLASAGTAGAEGTRDAAADCSAGGITPDMTDAGSEAETFPAAVAIGADSLWSTDGCTDGCASDCERDCSTAFGASSFSNRDRPWS